MKKPEDKLSFMQTLLMVSGTMIGAGVLTLPRSAAAADSPSGWIIILVQSLVFIGIVLLFMPFLQKNSGETIYELNQSIMGRAIGSLLNLFISCYFVVTVCFQARFLGEVINYFLLKNTPMGVVIFIFLAVGIYHVTGGVYPISKLYAYLFPIAIVILIVLLIFSLRLFKLDFVRPVLDGGYKSFFELFPRTLLYFSGLEVILYLVPFMKIRSRRKRLPSSASHAQAYFTALRCLSSSAVCRSLKPKR
ncbi:Spore germination protein B2 [Bacillus velezensis]|nr:Spore germination protein B2 [Bacillus velezensis]